LSHCGVLYLVIQILCEGIMQTVEMVLSWRDASAAINTYVDGGFVLVMIEPVCQWRGWWWTYLCHLRFVRHEAI